MYNGNGTFSRIMNWQQDKANNIFVTASRMDTDSNDFAAAFNVAFCRDGQAQATGNWNLGGFKIGNAGNATLRTDLMTLGQFEDATNTFGGTAGGTANAITFSLNPAITVYSAGQTFSFIASATNTGATTVNVNGAGAKNVFKRGAALTGGEIFINDLVRITYDGTQFNLEDSAQVGQVQNGAYIWGATSGGSANAQTISLTPALTAYAAGQAFRFTAGFSNTGAMTLAVNGLAATAIQLNGAALVAGNIKSGKTYEVIYEGAAFQLNSPATTGSLIAVQIFTASGTYTPTPGASSAIVEGVGGGGGGGGIQVSSGATNVSMSAPGTAGGYFKVRLTSLAVTTVTIGAAGTGGSGGANGNAGGTTSFGAIATGGPGQGGNQSGAAAAFPAVSPALAAGGTATINSGTTITSSTGDAGASGIALAQSTTSFSSRGGNSPFGTGGAQVALSASAVVNGNNGTGFGTGGSGAIGNNTASTGTGGSGAGGIIVVYEYS